MDAEETLFIQFLRVAAPIASQVVFLAPMSTMRKIRLEKSCGNISSIPYASMVVSGAVWTIYGLLKGVSSIWISNLPGIFLGGFYLSFFIRFVDSGERNFLTKQILLASLIFISVICCAVILPTAFALQVIGIVGVVIVVVMFGGPLAAIREVVRERSTRSIPPAFAAASLANCALWGALGAHLADPFIWFPNALGLVSSLAQVALFAVYGLPPTRLQGATRLPASDTELGALEATHPPRTPEED